MIATVAQIVRYPVKGFGPEVLHSVEVRAKGGIPGDRRFAIANGQQPVNSDGAWTPCQAFVRLTKNPSLPLFRVAMDVEAEVLRIDHPTGEAVVAKTNNPQSLSEATPQLSQWFAEGPHGSPRLIEAQSATAHWDHEDAAISLINLATVAQLEAQADAPLDPVRFRGNIEISGLEPWRELEWLGCRLKIGSVELEVLRPIDRCTAPSVNPLTGVRDMNIPALLSRETGHIFCGVYARVIVGGAIRQGDVIEKMGPAPQAMASGSRAQTAPSVATWPRSAAVSKIVQESETVRSFWLRDPLANESIAPPVRPGQHIRLHHLGKGRDQWRSYTVSGWDAAGGLRISVRHNPGGASAWLHDTVSVGDALTISGPFGSFTTPDERDRDVLLLSAGIGITPMVAMLSELAERGNSPVITLIHVERQGCDLALWDEVLALRPRLADFAPTLHLSGADHQECERLDALQGRPDLATSLSALDLARTEVFLCGPAGFMRAAQEHLFERGVHGDQIHKDAFISPKQGRVAVRPAPSPGPYTVTFSKSGVSATWTPSDNAILDLAEAQGLALPSHCRAGVCGTCRQSLQSGSIAYLTDVSDDVEKDAALICCAVPTSNLVIDA